MAAVTNAATTNAIQSGGILAALRLTKNVRNASDGELSGAVDLFGKSSKSCGWLLVFGLTLELGLAWLNFPYGSLCGRWGEVAATAVVLLGVYGEIQFSHWGTICQAELTRRSNENLQMMLLWAAPRRLTVEQAMALQGLKGKIEAVNVASEEGNEPRHFMTEIAFALQGLGIRVNTYRLHSAFPHVGIVVYDRSAMRPETMHLRGSSPVLDAVRATNLHVEWMADPRPDFSGPPPDPEIPLIVVGEKLPPPIPQPDLANPNTLFFVMVPSPENADPEG